MSRYPLSIMTLGLSLGLALGTQTAPAADTSVRDRLLEEFAAQAKQADPAFAGFSAERGATLYSSKFTTGNADTPSCTTCHGNSPKDTGKTRAGKAIEPLALSVNPQRLTDPAKVAKWFQRNCKSVLGRECTPLEKGDFIHFISAQ